MSKPQGHTATIVVKHHDEWYSFWLNGAYRGARHSVAPTMAALLSLHPSASALYLHDQDNLTPYATEELLRLISGHVRIEAWLAIAQAQRQRPQY